MINNFARSCRRLTGSWLTGGLLTDRRLAGVGFFASICFVIACMISDASDASAQFRYARETETPLRAVPVSALCSVSHAEMGFGFAHQATAAPGDTTFLGIFQGFTVGPFFTIGESRMNENIEHGWYSNPEVAFTIGGNVSFSLNDWIGINFGLAYDARDLFLGAKMAETTDDSVSIDMGISYIDIQPSLRIYWLILGLSIDVPMSANATESILHFGSSGASYSVNRNVDVSDLAPQTDLRGGLSIPVFHSDSGILDFLIMGSYPMGKVIAGTKSYDSTGYFSGIGKGRLPSVQAGVYYQFDLLH